MSEPSPTPVDPFEIVSVTPRLAVNDAVAAIEWYQKVFGAVVVDRTDNPDGRVFHSVLAIGPARIIVTDEFPETNTIAPTTVGASLGAVHLYVRDVDRVADRAFDAGAEPAMRKDAYFFEITEEEDEVGVAADHWDPAKPHDVFWGDRYVLITDPFGWRWELAKTRDLSPDDVKRGEEEFFRAGRNKLTADNARRRADRWHREHPDFNRPNVPPRERGRERPHFRWK
jgi:PhnB protein